MATRAAPFKAAGAAPSATPNRDSQNRFSAVTTPTKVIVVGAGLAGITATCELLESGCSVTLIDKNHAETTGNSKKASVGILDPRAEASETELNNRLPPSDPLRQKATDVDWLLTKLKMDKDFEKREVLGQKGKRVLCYRGEPQRTGLALCTRAGDIFKTLSSPVGGGPAKLTVLRGQKVTKLLKETIPGGVKVVGVEYQQDEAEAAIERHSLYGAVILCTGGFGGAPQEWLSDERGENGVANRMRLHGAKKGQALPSCQAPKVDGSGMHLALKAGSKPPVRLDEITLTPYGCAFPDETKFERAWSLETNNEKFELSAALVGNGCAIIDKNGELLKSSNGADLLCSADGVAEREEILKYMVSNYEKGPFTLVIGDLPQDLQPCIEWYTKEHGVCEDANRKNRFIHVWTNAKGCAASVGMKKPDGFGDGEKLMRVTKLEFSGLKSDVMYSAMVTPALYACSGGLQVDVDGKVAGKEGQMEGLFAAGETVAGPKQETYSLTGVPLLHCIVSGRAAARSAASAAFGASPPMRQTLEALVTAAKTMPVRAGLEEMSKEALIEEVKRLQACGGGGGGGGGAAGAAAGSGKIEMSEVAKHNTMADAWIVVNGEVLDITNWFKVHPGGVQALEPFMGKDASMDWNLIHSKDTIDKRIAQHGPSVLRKVGEAAGAKAASGEDPLFVFPPIQDGEPPLFQSENGLLNGIGKFVGRGWIGSLAHLAVNFLKNIGLTFLNTGNLRFKNERMGTIRSGLWLVMFFIMHSTDNQFAHFGRYHYNAMSYTLADRIQGAGTFGLAWFDAYIGLSVLLHASVGIKRSWDINLGYTVTSGKWKWLLSGLTVLTFLMMHFRDFRFAKDFDPASVQMVEVKLPSTLPVRLSMKPPFVWMCNDDDDPTSWTVKTRDIYTLMDTVFSQRSKVLQYVGFVTAVFTHLCYAWPKVVTSEALQIPKGHVQRVTYIGWVAAGACGSLYLSIPLFFYFGFMPSATGPASEICQGL